VLYRSTFSLFSDNTYHATIAQIVQFPFTGDIEAMVTIHLDTYGKDLKGTVQSIGGSTGAKESALAPENATGNFVKVVQRIPVRIRLDGYSEKDFPIVPGMSVETTIRPRD
jgi:multidrug resistance efflux pump